MKRWLLGSLLLFAVSPSGRAQEQALEIDKAQSRIEVLVKATVYSFTATLKDFQPRITVDQAGRIRNARIDFHFRDLSTGKRDRDEQMHAWQNTEQHPDGRFELEAISILPDGRSIVVGALTLHDRTRVIRFPVAIITDHRLYAVDGESLVDAREFGLPVIYKFGLLKVDPLVKVRFHLQGMLQ